MEKVTEKILEEAKKESAEIFKRYEAEAKRIKSEFNIKLNARREAIEKELTKLKAIKILRALSKQKLALNKRFTEEKLRKIDEVIQTAQQELHNHQEYLTFLKNLIKKSSAQEGNLFLSKPDKDRYGDQLEKFIMAEGLNYKIMLDNSITGGVVIKRENTTYLGSLEIISELLKDNLRIEVAKILFRSPI